VTRCTGARPPASRAAARALRAATPPGRFETLKIRSEPKQKLPYRPLGEVIKEEQVVHTLNGVQGTLISWRERLDSPAVVPTDNTAFGSAPDSRPPTASIVGFRASVFVRNSLRG
jgi:Alpha-acetolactate decarboxylase